MMGRLLGLVGRAEMTSPERFLGFWSRLALENPEECHFKWWVVPLARLEGLIFVSISQSEVPSPRFEEILGILGIPAVLFPEQYLDWGTELAYENPDQVEWKSWVVPLTRAVGIVYLLVGIRGLRKR